MKKIVVLVVLSLGFAGPVFAKSGERLEGVKAQVSAHIDKKIALLNKNKSCVMLASDKDSMKACRKSHKDAMKSLRAEGKAARSAMKAKFKKNKGKSS